MSDVRTSEKEGVKAPHEEALERERCGLSVLAVCLLSGCIRADEHGRILVCEPLCMAL